MLNLDNKDVFRRNLITGKTELVSHNYHNTKAAFFESRNIKSNGGPLTRLGSFPMETQLTIFGGGGIESVRVVGTSGNDSFSVAETGLVVRGAVLILDGIESRTIAGDAGQDWYFRAVDDVILDLFQGNQ